MAGMPRVITNNGYDIGYVEAGGGSATPIVFLHGVGSDKSVWRPQLAYFGRTRRTIAFDYPGYGDSDPAPEGTTRDDYASAIISAMHELGVDCAHICGLSLGGVVAIAIHHAAPERCASLILADTFAVHPEGRAIYERSLAGSRDLRAMAEARVDVLIAQPAEPAVRREVVETMSRIEPAAYCIGAEAVWLADQRDRAEEIQVPTLVLVGDQDLVTPFDLSSELVDLIPNARMQVIAGAGHLGNLEKPDEFNRFIEEFIGEAEAGT
jgi:3-oxoadipate enol-lactonase